MVLRSTCGTGAHALISSAVHSLSKNLVSEDGVVGDNRGSQMMRRALANFEYSVNLVVAILSHNLEGSKQLSGQQLALLLRFEVLQGHKHCSGLPSAVALGDAVVLQGSTSKQNLSAIKLKNGVEVGLDSVVVP